MLSFIFRLASAVEFFVDVAEVFVGDVRVYLGCCDTFVAEKLLHTAQVGTVAEEVGCVGMAKGMRRDFL